MVRRMEKLENNIDLYFEVDKPESRDSFKMMADFVDTLSDSNRLKSQLIRALENRKPFRGFKFIIDNSQAIRQEWFHFENRELKMGSGEIGRNKRPIDPKKSEFNYINLPCLRIRKQVRRAITLSK
jgi:hypothetical protein